MVHACQFHGRRPMQGQGVSLLPSFIPFSLRAHRGVIGMFHSVGWRQVATSDRVVLEQLELDDGVRF